MSAISLAAALVRSKEGCRLAAYQDGASVWTIGWGATGPEIGPETVWTRDQADARLTIDLQAAADGVTRLKQRLLSDQQMAALISFAFNLGLGALAGSQLLAAVNDCRWIDAARLWINWDHIGKTENKGLLIRRMDEAALFLRGSPA